MTQTPARVRRFGVSFLLCALIQGLAPPPALAWFGWLDKWSGPGPFWGELFEVRLACFGEQSGVRQIVEAYTRAQRSSRIALSAPGGPTAEQEAVVRADWLEAVRLLEMVQDKWKASPTSREPITALIGSDFLKPPSLQLEAKPGAAARRPIAPIQGFVTLAENAVPRALQSLAGQVIAAGGTGVFFSICSEEKARRLSIELNVDHWHGFDNDNNRAFSNGDRIQLITVMPSATWSVIGSRNADVVDVGIAGGYYSFSSAGFDAVRGFILEPIRIEIHAPSSWAGHPRTDARRIASLFTYRWGLMTVPSGFAANAFADSARPGRIPAELVPVHGIFVNLNSLLSNPKRITLAKTQAP